MSIKDTLDFFFTYLLPLLALIASFGFYRAGKHAAHRAEFVLEEIRKTTQGWQNQIMTAATDIINARPEVTGNKLYLAKIEVAKNMSVAIQKLSEQMAGNPKTGPEGAAQTAHLKQLLDHQFYYFRSVIDNNPLPDLNVDAAIKG